MIYTILLVLWPAVIAFQETKNICPPLVELKPCACVSDGTNVRLDCIRVTSLSDARRAVSRFRDYSNVFMDFLTCQFDSRIPSNLFSGVKVYQLSFTKSKLKGIGDEGQASFLGLEDSLEELTITFSFPEEEGGMKFLNISNLRRLEYLEIEGNYISNLGDDWFRDGPKSLQDVYIMFNFIKTIGRNAFSSLVNVKNLWLTGNEFSVVERSMFPKPARHLISLDLSNNKISYLPNDLFIEMPSLKEIVLDENKIQSLSAETWLPIWSQLSHLYLVENPLDCDSNMNWMLKIRRPYVLKGNCASPPSKKGQELKRLIDDADNIY